jgi:hypothetical protein
VVDQVFEKRSVQYRRALKLLAGDSGADDRENAGTDDSANAEGGQTKPAQRFLKFYFSVFGVRQELIDALTVEEF